MRFIITDLKRALTEKSFVGALLIGSISLLIGIVVYGLEKDSYTAGEAFHFSQSFILPFIAPLLVALPYANMSMLEEDSGYKKLLLAKNNMKNYAFERYIVNGIISGLTLLIPLMLLLGVCLSFGRYESVKEILLIIGLDFIFGFSYGSLAYGLTFVNSKRYIPTVAPQVIYMLFIYAFPYLNLEKFYPPLSFAPGLIPSVASIDNALVQLIVLNAIAIVLIVGKLCLEKLMAIRQGD